MDGIDFRPIALRTLQIFGLDANSRLGTSVSRTPEGYILVGSCGHSVENAPGRRLRIFLEKHTLTAINPFFLRLRELHITTLEAIALEIISC